MDQESKRTGHPSLEVQLCTSQVPRKANTPVELLIKNTGQEAAQYVELTLQEQPDFTVSTRSLSIANIEAHSNYYQVINITPVHENNVHLAGQVVYLGPDHTQYQTTFAFDLTITSPAQYPDFYSSPYITGVQVRDSRMFFGRRDEIKKIIRTLEGTVQNRPVILYGLWKVGKTSILEQLRSADPDEIGVSELWRLRHNHYSVVLDFQSLSRETAAWRIYHHMYDSIERGLRAYVPQMGVITDDQFRSSDTPDTLLIRFLENVLQKLKDQDKKLLLMLDEFHTLLNLVKKDDPILGRLRELSGHSRVAVIFVGPINLVKLMRDKAPRIYELCDLPILLGRLSDPEARELITRPMQTNVPAFTWTDEAIEYILKLADRYPWYIQTICNQIVFRLMDSKRLQVTWTDVHEVVRILDTLRHFDSVFDREIDDISLIDHLILVSIAHLAQQSDHERWIADAEIEQLLFRWVPDFDMTVVPKALESLCDHHLIVVNEFDSQQYRIRQYLLNLYLKRTTNLPEVLRKGGFIKEV